MWENWTHSKSPGVWPVQPIVYIGCMTGTSVDQQADFTAAVFDDNGGVLGYYNYAVMLPKALQAKLVVLSQRPSDQLSVSVRNQAQVALSQFLVSAYQEVIEASGLSHYPREAIVLSPHGQAIDHQPLAPLPYTDVIVNGELIAYSTGCRVVTRHRQGALTVSLAAPLAPVLLQRLFYDKDVTTVILNGGGMANICVLPAKHPHQLMAYDVGPANAPMDEWVQYTLDRAIDVIPNDLKEAIVAHRFDYQGRWVSRGHVLPHLLKRLQSHPYFERSTQAKSVDRASFGLDWIMAGDTLSVDRPQDWADRLATLAEVVISQIVKSVVNGLAALKEEDRPCRFLVSGGLSANDYIMDALKRRLYQPGSLEYVAMDTMGYDANFIESLLFAYLGCCAINGHPIDVSYCGRAGVAQPAKAIPGVVALPPSFLS